MVFISDHQFISEVDACPHHFFTVESYPWRDRGGRESPCASTDKTAKNLHNWPVGPVARVRWAALHGV